MTAVEQLGSNSFSTMNTVDSNTVSTEINNTGQDSFKKEEEELEKLAMNEILIETKRRAETAREFGALGWQKSPLLPVNKQFLKNTLVSTLRSVPDMKKEKKNNEQKVWKNQEYKSSYRRHSSDNDVNSFRSRHRISSSKVDERDKDSTRRFGQPSNSQQSRSRHSDKHSRHKTRDSASSKSFALHRNKNELKSESDLAPAEQKETNLPDNSSMENSHTKAGTKTDSLALNDKETSIKIDNDVKLKEVQDLPNKPEHEDHEPHLQSVKRKRSESRGDNTTSSKKRKHHSRHKKDCDKKHKSKRKSKKHKKKDSEA